jgi:hypothetical protein
MVNSPLTGAAARGGAASLGDRCRAYAQTGVTDPYFTGLVVFVVTTGLYGISNALDYFKKKKTGKEAISDTFKASGKVGVCSIIGITAGNGVAGTGLVLIAPSVLPIAAGITATYLLKRFWDKNISGTKDAASVAPSAIS